MHNDYSRLHRNIYELSEHDEGHLCDCLPEYLVSILSPIGLPGTTGACRQPDRDCGEGKSSPCHCCGGTLLCCGRLFSCGCCCCCGRCCSCGRCSCCCSCCCCCCCCCGGGGGCSSCGCCCCGGLSCGGRLNSCCEWVWIERAPPDRVQSKCGCQLEGTAAPVCPCGARGAREGEDGGGSPSSRCCQEAGCGRVC